MIFLKKWTLNLQDFLNTFEKTIKQVSKKYKVSEKQLMGYFEKEDVNNLGVNDGIQISKTYRNN